MNRLLGMPRIARYFLVGGTAALFDIGIFYALVQLGVFYLIAGAVSFVVATAVNHVLGKRFVFADREDRGLRTTAGIYLVSGVGLMINQLILWICIAHLLFFPLVAKLTATGIVFFWNYFARNYLVFRRSI